MTTRTDSKSGHLRIADDEAPTASTGEWAGVHAGSRWRLAYAGGFLLVLMAGFVAALLNPSLINSPDDTLSDGAWAEAYQARFDAGSPLLAPSQVTWGVLDTVLFGQGRTGVLVGSAGWLYSREEYAIVDDFEGAIDAWVARVASVRDELAGHGAALVVAIVPAKASMVSGHVPAPLPSAALERYGALKRGLEAAGVAVSDLRPALSSSSTGAAAYLRTDTHWSPEGAAAAADAIARTVEEHAPFDALHASRYVTELGEPVERWGDLSTFLNLGPLLERLGPPPDVFASRQTVSAEPAGDDLFAEVEVPVALVGTSYSADPTWNTLGALREALGADVLDATLTGQGPWEPMRRYLEGEALRSATPEVVVWEIPERYVTLEGHVPESTTW